MTRGYGDCRAGEAGGAAFFGQTPRDVAIRAPDGEDPGRNRCAVSGVELDQGAVGQRGVTGPVPDRVFGVAQSFVGLVLLLLVAWLN